MSTRSSSRLDEERLDELADTFRSSEEDTACKDRSSKSHQSSGPKGLDATVLVDILDGLCRCRDMRTLASCLDTVERLGCVRSDQTCDCTIRKVDRGALLYVSSILPVFDDVVAAHAKASRASLLQRGAR